jgi:fibronectin-binding autotransporter adhesin
MLCVGVIARAATTTYTGVYAGGTIAPDDTVVLDDGATVTGNVIANGTLQFNQSATTLTISNTISGTGRLSLTNTGTVVLTGSTAGTTSIVLDMNTSVSQGTLKTGSSGVANLSVGCLGGGSLSIDGGRVVSGATYLGETLGGNGIVTVSSGTLNGVLMTVGDRGVGSLNITGGAVGSYDLSIGRNAGGSGFVTVTDGRVSTSSGMWIGYSGTGQLTMSGGRVFDSPPVYGQYNPSYLGYNAGSVGTAIISGGEWLVTGSLYVGFGGTGKLTISSGSVNAYYSNVPSLVHNVYVGHSGTGTAEISGGTLNTETSYLGYSRRALGMATVSSGTWFTTSGLNIGYSGTGRLVVTGGRVNGGRDVIGVNAGSNGSALVSGGTWWLSNLIVGGTGTGSLEVSGSGVVQVLATLSKGTAGAITIFPGGTIEVGRLACDLVNNGTLAFNPTLSSTYTGIISGTGSILKRGEGTLTLTGQQVGSDTVVSIDRPLILETGTLVSGVALWGSPYGYLQIGSTGTGSLLVGGGTLISNAGEIAASAGSVGSATITGGTWANSSNLYVGDGGSATLAIQGGYVSTSVAYLGYRNDSTGVATVSGGLWDSADALFVGYSGTGVMTVTGGSVAVSGRSYNPSLYVGYGGVGVLHIRGGSVVDTRSYIGYRVTGSGTVAVASGTWDNSGSLFVGYSGNGSLSINGGSVNSLNCYIGFEAGSNGSAAISGGTCSPKQGLFMGYRGNGMLTMTDGSITNLFGYLGYNASSNGMATVTGGTWANTYSLDVGLSGTGTLNISGGLVSVAGTLSRGAYGTINLNAGGTLQIGTGTTSGWLLSGTGSLTNNGTLIFNRSDASTYSGVLSGSGVISKQGAGVLTFSGPNTLTGPTTIQQGTLKLAHATALSASKITLVAGGTVLLSPYLQTTVGGLDPNAGGLVDVGNGYVTVANGLSQLSLVAALQSGRAGGLWTGSSGITSSAAASTIGQNTLRTVGWLDNGGGSLSFAFAAPGDTNLDWAVDILDAGNFLSFGKFDTGLPATWIEGDFNYDGRVDILDAADFSATGLYGAGGYNAPGAALLIPVPEPSAGVWWGIGLAVGAWVIRRR